MAMKDVHGTSISIEEWDKRWSGEERSFFCEIYQKEMMGSGITKQNPVLNNERSV